MKKIIITTIFLFLYFIPASSNSEVKKIFEGNVDAKIKLIVFESLTCSHCANFHKNVYPGLKEDFIDKGLVYIELISDLMLVHQYFYTSFHLLKMLHMLLLSLLPLYIYLVRI